ncbi:hypothetical protein V2K51_20360 [Pseudomonas alliivorans]|nr:hypothetical protein [Pseudomonas alliivorans]MEE4794895.1 hypothetical protein [Pseudomonas alliivorans]MEE4829409.1 hypothetical protein [Pseudomonas alliivorans]MEE4840373.1 hypothetical protein [Pseudomonas alliivorans]MEE4855450.1 hypothetical protein [Pseudomonas alliivorans]
MGTPLEMTYIDGRIVV